MNRINLSFRITKEIIAEEQFVKDIDKAIKEMNEYYAGQNCDENLT